MQFPTDAPVALRDRLDVGLLVTYLRSSSRTRPVVLLTVADGANQPFVSAPDLAREFGRDIDVVTLPSKDLTFALSDAVGKEASAFLGACRVYPPGDRWQSNPRSLSLHLGRDEAERRAMQSRIADDVRRALSAATPTATPAPRVAPAGPGTVPKPGPPSPPADGVRIVDDPASAAALAAHLTTPARKRPVVVITRASGAAAAYVDAEELRADLAGLADVAEITGAEASWAFSQAVPDQCQVYGGASRVYPIGDDWTADPYLSPLRFAYGPSDKVKVTRQLISDALSMAARGGLTLGSGTEAPCVVTGEVQGVIGDRALVTIPGVQMGGTLWPELVLPDLAAERLFCKGMRVVGTFDPESRRIDVTGMRRSAVDALSGYRDGDTVLARVVGVDGGGCDVELFPGEVRRVGAEDIAEDGATVADLVAAGDVVALWFGEPEAGQWLLSMLDAADPAEAVPAPSVLDGGPPWLVTVDKAEPAGDDEAPEGAEESTGLTPEQQREKALIIKRLRRAENEIEELTLQLQESRKRLRAAQKRLKRRQGAVTAVDRLFEGDADQLDFEIGAAWARMIPPAQKHELRLRPHRFGDHFLATMAEVEGIARDKVVEVIVHVLTGLDAELDSRGRYQLRTGEGGDNPARTRNGGEVCWRVSLQANTPGARRLHYWTCHDWTIELSSIRVHDDYRP